MPPQPLGFWEDSRARKLNSMLVVPCSVSRLCRQAVLLHKLRACLELEAKEAWIMKEQVS